MHNKTSNPTKNWSQTQDYNTKLINIREKHKIKISKIIKKERKN